MGYMQEQYMKPASRIHGGRCDNCGTESQSFLLAGWQPMFLRSEYASWLEQYSEEDKEVLLCPICIQPLAEKMPVLGTFLKEAMPNE